MLLLVVFIIVHNAGDLEIIIEMVDFLTRDCWSLIALLRVHVKQTVKAAILLLLSPFIMTIITLLGYPFLFVKKYLDIQVAFCSLSVTEVSEPDMCWVHEQSTRLQEPVRCLLSAPVVNNFGENKQ